MVFRLVNTSARTAGPKESPMVTLRRFLPILVLALLLVASCDSTPKQPEPTRGGGAREPAEVKTVTVPTQCVEQIAAFFNRSQLVLADYVTIDASADPFHGAATTSMDEKVVEKIEAVDTDKRMTIVRYRNRSGQPHVESVLPKVRFGDGFLVVATREITVRYHKKVRPARPIFFDLAASGEVVYSDTHSSEKLKGPRLGMRVEVKEADGGYMFSSRVK